MKFTHQRHDDERASALVVTLFLTTAILIGIGSYLLLVRSQYVSVTRSQAWNSALTMAEAGVEEGLAQLNPGAQAPSLSVDRSANGWGLPSGGFYGPVSRSNITNSTYSVVYSDTTYPTLYSTGYVTLPDISATLKRVVCVLTTNVPLYNVALAARTNITMNGNGLSVDSFNSSKTNLSANGRYDGVHTTTNGDVAVLYGSLSPGNHSIAGDVYLGPTATYGGSANQVSGSIYTDYNYNYPDVALPNTNGWFVLAARQPGTVGGVSYDYVFNSSGNYIIPTTGGSGAIYVNTNANVNLLINGGGTGTVLVNTNGTTSGKLTVYVGASSFGIAGNGSADGGKAANLAYYGLPSCTSISLSGNASFTGTIYAPSAALSLNGGGNNSYDFVGSGIFASVTFNGHFMFHFDEDLLTSGASRGYYAVSWKEL